MKKFTTISTKPDKEKKEVTIIFENGETFIALYEDWNRALPCFTNSYDASELIATSIKKGKMKNAKLVKIVDENSLYENGAVIKNTKENTYLDALESFRK